MAGNIEILYLYIKKYKRLENIQLNFSGKYIIELVDDYLKVDKNENYPSSIFPIPMYQVVSGTNRPSIQANQINNVSAIIGENGVGKSLLLECLIKILTNDFRAEEEFVVGLSVNDEIEFFHSFKKELNSDYKLTVGKETRSFIEQYYDKGKPELNNLYIPYFENTKVIYYSPIADLQTFPYHIDDPEYNDISTNYLLEYDQERNAQFLKDNPDKLLSHKYKSIERFINLIYSNITYPKEIQSFIPEETYIKFNKIKDPEDNERNLKPNDKEFLAKFLETYSFEISRGKDIRKKIKLEFCFSLVNLIFHEKQKDFNLPSTDKIFDIPQSNLPILTATREFIQKQKVMSSTALLLIFDNIIELIDQSQNLYEELGSYFIQIKDYAELITVLTNYRDLQLNLKHSKEVLIDFYWRNMSSGEKSMLDIFSRFLDTRDKNFVNQGSAHRNASDKLNKQFSTVFILIDEGEMGFHPQWQKNYLKYLLEFFRASYLHLNIQLFLTTHSPFLVSDLPVENITFLKKEQNRIQLCNEKIGMNTFGGNIHELFSNSFFLKNGIIGAFAQEVINERVIQELISTDKIDNEKAIELKKIIELIGEPVVKHKLKRMLQNKELIKQ